MHQRVSWLRRAFNDWPVKMLQPIIVNLLTAFLLFSLAIMFKPLLSELIHGPVIDEYPIICAAEPYPGLAKDELRTDFFIINREGKAFTRTDLEVILKNFTRDKDTSPSPDIILTVRGAEPFEVIEDANFNRDKGHITFNSDETNRTIHIGIERIAPRAIIKYTVVVRGLPYISKELSRMAKSSIHFDHNRYLDGCYKK